MPKTAPKTTLPTHLPAAAPAVPIQAQSAPRLRFRQVHLDFHTSEAITGIGERFSRRQFQRALKLGRVDSITIFAKCHHGWSYYPTKAGRVHPHLLRDLLGEQIAACHAIGVRAPIYITVGWSANDAATHPDWVVRRRDGSPWGMNVKTDARPDEKRPTFSWTFLCPGTGYGELLTEQTREVCAAYDVDGIFYDICMTEPCWCVTCRAGMAAAGVDAEDEAAARRYSVAKWQRAMARCNAVIHSHHAQATIFWNGLAEAHTPPELRALQTHYELEDLPTTWGGYDKFPLRARVFARTAAGVRPDGARKDYLAMSGKFHTAWGEFGGFKHRDAIRFEAASMLSYGARCSIGDQLHPSGEMDLATYANLAEGYRLVERLEPFVVDADPAGDVGLWLSGNHADDQGAANMLLETHRDFQVVDADSDLGGIGAVVLAGRCLDRAAGAKLAAFARAGGAVLALGEGPLVRGGDGFALDLGAELLGASGLDCDYLIAGKALARDLPASPFLCYAPAVRARATSATVLAAIREPYFNRTYATYCSHQNTPWRLDDAPQAGALRRGRLLWLTHALGRLYHEHGARVHRQLFDNALRLLRPKPRIEVGLPSAGRVSLTHQPRHRRYVAHLLYGAPLQRGRCQVIDDLPTLRDVALTLRLPHQPRRAWSATTRRPLRLARRADAVTLSVPELTCHEAVVIDY